MKKRKLILTQNDAKRRKMGHPWTANTNLRHFDPLPEGEGQSDACRNSVAAMNAWVGVDPGATGAIAMVREDGGVIVRDFPGDECALVGLLSALETEAEVKAVWVEQQQAMPGQGVSSTFKLGQNFGAWITAMAFMRWPYRTVRPAEWKRGLGYPAKDKKASKAYSLTLARRLYPQAAALLSRAGDHNRAEALILAHLAKTGA